MPGVVRRWCFHWALAALALALAGCASAPPPLQPKGRVAVPADAAATRVQASAKTLNEVVISLPPVQTAGHRWVLMLNDARVLQPWRPLEAAADGTTTATFLAIKPGKRLVRFFALPAVEREAVPSQAYEVAIEIE